MRRPNIVRITKNRVPMKTLNRQVMGTGFGCGVGSFLLDGGVGGQNSYHSIEDYEQTTGRKLNAPKGRGLADKIGERLSKINIDKKIPKKKNITMNF
jgi:hypothetical protein